MSAAQMNNLDLMPPPVVQTIGRRSLIIGAIVGVVAIAGGVFQPTVFFRGYLLSFMAWLGIALGSMVILMLRHLTKGGRSEERRVGKECRAGWMRVDE